MVYQIITVVLRNLYCCLEPLISEYELSYDIIIVFPQFRVSSKFFKPEL